MLQGQIDGDVVMVAGLAHLARGSSVSGDLTYGDEAPRIARSARVGGEVQKESWSDVVGLYSIVGVFVLWLAVGISGDPRHPAVADRPACRRRGVRAGADRFWTAVGIGAAIAVQCRSRSSSPRSPWSACRFRSGSASRHCLRRDRLRTAAWALGRVIVKPPGRILAFLAGLAILRLPRSCRRSGSSSGWAP